MALELATIGTWVRVILTREHFRPRQLPQHLACHPTATLAGATAGFSHPSLAQWLRGHCIDR